jgi:hypothetical protein
MEDEECFARWKEVGENIPRGKINIKIDFPGPAEKYFFCEKSFFLP